MSVSARVHNEMTNLGTHPHVLKVAAQIHPTWVAAHGHIHDPGVERLAVDIGQCIAAIHYGQEQGDDMSRRFVIGPGFIVVPGPGIEGYSVAVTAGELFDSHLEMGVA